MHRLFVALRLPPALRQLCLAAMEPPLPGWRWQSQEQLHLTLRFIGEVDRRRAEDIAVALTRVDAAPLSLALSGVGWFDQGPGGALFARASPRDPFASLHSKVDRALMLAGLKPEGRSFLPHITLARGRKSAAAPHEWLERHAGLTSAQFPIDRFHLMESSLARDGALYEIAETYPLSRA